VETFTTTADSLLQEKATCKTNKLVDTQDGVISIILNVMTLTLTMTLNMSPTDTPVMTLN